MIADVTGYKLGGPVTTFADQVPGHLLTVTFVLTEDCNLACGYCYMVGKNKKSPMTFEVAKKAIDHILSQDLPHAGVVWDFIGGEPLLETDLMHQISDYAVYQMWARNHKWFDYYAFNISSNGTLYAGKKVQEYVTKYATHLSIGLTIDGIREKHDMHRKFPTGAGSFDLVEKNVKLWIQQFPEANTKVTFASDDLPFLKDSIVHLWDLGIKTVPANVVFENLWKEGDDLVFEQQMRDLADYAIESGRWKTNNCTLFDETLGGPVSKEFQERNWCGAGLHMLTINHEGKFYPCVRFMDYSLSNKPGICLGDVENGINQDRLRPFLMLTSTAQSPEECINCPISNSCAWCQGFNYDSSDNNSMFKRATYICKMHKARVRANQYYWARLAKLQHAHFNDLHGHKLQIILSDDSVPICKYEAKDNGNRMSPEVYRAGIDFAAQNQFFPVLLQPRDGSFVELPDFPGWHAVNPGHAHVPDAEYIVFENAVTNLPDHIREAVLVVDKPHLPSLAGMLTALLPVADHTCLELRGTHEFSPEDFELYRTQLGLVADYIAENPAAPPRLNVLTDLHQLTVMKNCDAGVNSFALAPNGLLYICPAFYYDDPASAIGSLETGIDWRKVDTCKLSKAPLCTQNCSAYHCHRCVFENVKYTGELNVPPKSQCVTTHIEFKQSDELAQRLNPSSDVSANVNISDPYDLRWENAFLRRA